MKAAIVFALITGVLTFLWVLFLNFLKQTNPDLSMSPLVMLVPFFLMITISAARKKRKAD